MKKVFQLEGEIYQFLSKGYELLVINLLLILFSLPVFTIGSAVNAAFHILIDLEEENLKGIPKIYWHYFKNHFIHSTFLYLGSLGIALLAVGLVILTIQTPVQFLSLILAAFTGILLLNLLTTAAYQEFNLKRTMIIAFGMSLKYTGYFCLSITGFVLSVLIPIFLPKLMFLWFFFGFSLPMLLQIKLYIYCTYHFKNNYSAKGETK